MKKPKKAEIALTTEALEEANIPRRFWKMGRNDYFGSSRALKACESYIHESMKAYKRGLSLLIQGETDSGKTWLISYVLRCLLAQNEGYTVFYTTLDDLTEYMIRPEKDERFSQKFLASDFVALDCVNTANEGTRPAFRKFVRLRIDNAMPFILGTSLSLTTADDAFESLFGDSATKAVHTSVVVHANVSQFKVQRYYKRLKKGIADA